MISIVNDTPYARESVELAAAMTQGQWGLGSDFAKVTPVASEANTKEAVGLLGMVFQEVIDIEGADTDHDDIAIATMGICVNQKGLVIEDDMAGSNSSGDFDNASYGDSLYLTATGYLTTDGAADFVSGSTAVAKFLKYEASILYYEML